MIIKCPVSVYGGVSENIGAVAHWYLQCTSVLEVAGSIPAPVD